MANIYLIRKLGTFVPYEDVESVSLTSDAVGDYTGITGVDSTDVITVPNYTPTNGDSFVFTSKTGGSGLTLGATYYVGDASGNTFKPYTAASGGSIVSLGSNITAGTIRVFSDDLRVWSSEYRDQFSQTGEGWKVYGTYTSETVGSPPETVTHRSNVPYAGQSGIVIVPGSLSVKTQGATTGSGQPADNSIVVATEAVSASISDEVAHTPLRQTSLKRTHWKFVISNFGSLYATWESGDIISNNPPNTVLES